MKLRKSLVKFASCILITTLIASVTACGSKESKDKEEKEEVVVDKTVDELVEEMSANTTALSTDMIETSLEDGYLTYEEYEEAVKTIPSYKAEGEFVFDASLFMECDCNVCEGELLNEQVAVNSSYIMEYDSKTMSVHYGFDMIYLDNPVEIDYWIINEDGTYYLYEYDSLVGTTYRTEIGNIKEAFGENGISKENLDAVYEEFKSEIEAEFGSLPTSEELENSTTVEDLKNQLSLDDKYVNHDGKDYYDLVMNLNANDIVSILEENGELQTVLDYMGLEAEVDELLSMDLTSTVSVQDIFDIVDVDVNYYIDPTELFVAHMEMDFSDVVNDSFELTDTSIKDYLIGHNVNTNFKCNEARIYYDYDNDVDVTVTFDGEYEEY